MRLIDAEEAYKVLTDYYHHGTEIQHKALKEAIERVPIVDAEPVVRCKDCKHNSLGRFLGNTYCDLGIGLYQLDNFCSRGERREYETD